MSCRPEWKRYLHGPWGRFEHVTGNSSDNDELGELHRIIPLEILPPSFSDWLPELWWEIDVTWEEGGWEWPHSVEPIRNHRAIYHGGYSIQAMVTGQLPARASSRFSLNNWICILPWFIRSTDMSCQGVVWGGGVWTFSQTLKSSLLCLGKFSICLCGWSFSICVLGRSPCVHFTLGRQDPCGFPVALPQAMSCPITEDEISPFLTQYMLALTLEYCNIRINFFFVLSWNSCYVASVWSIRPISGFHWISLNSRTYARRKPRSKRQYQIQHSRNQAQPAIFRQGCNSIQD